MIAQFATGFVTGLFIGIIILSHAFLRAVVLGAIAGAILGVIAIYGVDGYVNWASHLPIDIPRLSAFWFWFGAITGIIVGVRIWVVQHIP